MLYLITIILFSTIIPGGHKLVDSMCDRLPPNKHTVSEYGRDINSLFQVFAHGGWGGAMCNIHSNIREGK